MGRNGDTSERTAARLDEISADDCGKRNANADGTPPLERALTHKNVPPDERSRSRSEAFRLAVH